MKRYALLLMPIVLTACGDRPVVVTSIDTLCTSTTRYHATDGQIDQFKMDPLMWGPLVDWLASFNKVRDGECLKPAKGL